MYSFLWTTLAALAARAALAQEAGSEDGANNSTTPTAQDGNRTIHYVDVAKGGHFYKPNSILAEVGDIVTFRFYPTNHSVIKAEYGYPCIPYEDIVTGGEGFDSGFFETMTITDNPETWNLTVNSTEPVFYYCGAPGSCTDWGMVGVINPNASTDIAKQISLAKEADYMLLPGEPFPDEAIQSISSIAATLTTETVIQTPTSKNAAQASASNGAGASSSSSSGGLSGGAIAGIVVGAVAGLAILAALFFLLGRTKSMKDRRDANSNAHMSHPPSWMPPPHAQGYFNGNNPHASAQLPPYGHPDHQAFWEHKPPNERDSLASGPMSPPLPSQSPPPQQMGQHPMPGFQGGQNSNRFTATTSELTGSEPQPAEIYTPKQDGTSPTAQHGGYKYR